jgi:hypothetical protein
MQPGAPPGRAIAADDYLLNYKQSLNSTTIRTLRLYNEYLSNKPNVSQKP